MNLLEFINTTQKDFDAYDDVYDTSVTVCLIEKDGDESDEFHNYDKFCKEIIKLVEVIKQTDDCIVIVKWTDLIKRNMARFREFTKKYWNKYCQYENDEDEFIYQWITEIDNYMAGNVPLEFYKTLVNFVETLN